LVSTDPSDFWEFFVLQVKAIILIDGLYFWKQTAVFYLRLTNLGLWCLWGNMLNSSGADRLFEVSAERLFLWYSWTTKEQKSSLIQRTGKTLKADCFKICLQGWSGRKAEPDSQINTFNIWTVF
jgi:hypothetical protein